MGRAAELGPAPAEPGEVAGEQKADFKSVLGNKTPSSAREAQTVLGERPGGESSLGFQEQLVISGVQL